MSLIRYQRPNLSNLSPFGRLSPFRDDVNRLFDLSYAIPGTLRDRSSGILNPALDVYQDKDRLSVRCELPGLKREDIQITLHEGTVTIEGERKTEREIKEGESSRSERFFGQFRRSVTLPVAVDAGSVQAQYKDGVLTVTLAKAEEAKPKQIDVQVS